MTATISIFDPSTGGETGSLPADDAAAIAEKFALAKAAQPAWAARPLTERVEILRRFSQLLIREKARLAKLLSVETGKPISQALGELGGTPPRVDYFLDTVAQATASQMAAQDGPVPGTGAMDEVITWEPLGVVANISAWNYPYFVGTNVLVPALLTGNTVLYKPSEYAAQTGLAMVALLHEAGVPGDVVQAVIGDGQAGAALLEQPIDGVYFTGSYPTGKRIAEAVAGRLIRVQLELGGKDPAYVCPDADPAAAAAGLADGAFYNAGQSCCAVERIYVHADLYAPFIAAFEDTVKAFTIGAPADAETYLGPLTRFAQLEVLRAQIADAVDKGGRVVTGGGRVDRPGWYFQPTVVVDANAQMRLMREESFGPVIGIQRVESDAEALALMNDTEYGLTAAVYTPDRVRAAGLMRQLDAGTVYWNCCDRISPRLPWSGRGHSGVGSTLSVEGIRAFVQPKAWHLRT